MEACWSLFTEFVISRSKCLLALRRKYLHLTFINKICFISSKRHLPIVCNYLHRTQPFVCWQCLPCCQQELSQCWDWLVAVVPSPTSSRVQMYPGTSNSYMNECLFNNNMVTVLLSTTYYGKDNTISWLVSCCCCHVHGSSLLTTFLLRACLKTNGIPPGLTRTRVYVHSMLSIM